ETIAAVGTFGRGDDVLVCGELVRRFYRSGAGARSLTEVVASGIKRLRTPGEHEPDLDEVCAELEGAS
ncbi:MAG: hypothetical protein WD670_02900, partial [Actinomycetota bacterium]